MDSPKSSHGTLKQTQWESVSPKFDLEIQLISAGVKSVEALFAHYPGIEKKVSALEFMAARQDISEEAFKGVDPMKGAIKLVKGLVSARWTRWRVLIDSTMLEYPSP